MTSSFKFPVGSTSKAPAKRLWGQILLLVFFIACGAMAWGWIANDITGEYVANDRQIGVVHMSIIRKATSVKSELSYGTGAILETSAPFASAGDQVNWTFTLPEKWVEQGQKQHKVYFHGKVENGEVTGVLQDGAAVVPIKLTRDALASLYRQLQSHLPWVS